MLKKRGREGEHKGDWEKGVVGQMGEERGKQYSKKTRTRSGREGEHKGGGDKGVVGQMGGERGKQYSKNSVYK